MALHRCSTTMNNVLRLLFQDSPTFGSCRNAQVDLLVSSLRGGYEGSKEDLEGWFPKQIMHFGEMVRGALCNVKGEVDDVKKSGSCS